PPAPIVAKTTPTVALYILNNKPAFVDAVEARYGAPITVQASDTAQGASFSAETASRPVDAQRRPARSARRMDSGFGGEEAAEEAPREEEVTAAEAAESRWSRRRRRRRRRGERADRTQVSAVPGNRADEEAISSYGEHEQLDEEEEPGAEAAEGEL